MSVHGCSNTWLSVRELQRVGERCWMEVYGSSDSVIFLWQATWIRDGLKKSFDVYYFSRLRICVLPKLGEKPTSKGQEFAECCNNSSRFCTYPSLYFFGWFEILHGLQWARCFWNDFLSSLTLTSCLKYKLAMSFRKQSELSRGSTSFSSSNDPVWTGNCNVRHNVIADSPN